jgi:hypothetical protein
MRWRVSQIEMNGERPGSAAGAGAGAGKDPMATAGTSFQRRTALARLNRDERICPLRAAGATALVLALVRILGGRRAWGRLS